MGLGDASVDEIDRSGIFFKILLVSSVNFGSTFLSIQIESNQMNRFERDYVGHMVRQQREDDLCHLSHQVHFNHTSKSSIVDIVQF